jgi:hypothetical protein
MTIVCWHSVLFSPDLYFQPQEEVALANQVTDNDSNEEETSDDIISFLAMTNPDPPSPPVTFRSRVSGASAKSCSLTSQIHKKMKRGIASKRLDVT